MKKNKTDLNEHLGNILKNIRIARELSSQNESVRNVIVVSGSETDRIEWKNRFDKTARELFNNDGSTHVLSLLEKTGSKTREGNFLGTLLAYRNLKQIAEIEKIDYVSGVCLLGMLFGRGERISPFTQIEGCRKPAIRVGTIRRNPPDDSMEMTALEEALLYFTPIVSYLEKRGFRGILDKWGDETEIASIDLASEPGNKNELSETDVIKFISNIEITAELAPQKDWVISDDTGRVIAMLARNEKSIIEEKIASVGKYKPMNGKLTGGVSLGPVAVSYGFLEVALSVFGHEIEKDGVFFDFDPYLLMRLAFIGSKAEWEKSLAHDKAYGNLITMIPDFFEKVEELKQRFREKYGRDIVYKSFDMGDMVYWADIGQHAAMREKFMLLLDRSASGTIARRLEGIPEEMDENGNIIISSMISDEVTIRDSVIIDSVISGKGSIDRSVISHSVLDTPRIDNAFAVSSYRPRGPVELSESSGLYRSMGDCPLTLGKLMRHGTLLLENGELDMYIREDTDLRDKARNYDQKILSNPISFKDAYDRMFGVSIAELERRRKRYMEKLNGNTARAQRSS